jgi:uncharacterized protein (TIGR00725 family)
MTVYLAVIGGDPAPDDLLMVAEEVGAAIAERGAYLVCGGLGGVMEAACRGAKEAGGTTIGILPSTDRAHANAYVDVAIPTGMGEMRNALIIRSADAVIAVGGEYGTLSEIGFGLKTGKPVVGIAAWELSKKGRFSDAIVRADDARGAVDIAVKLAGAV